MRLSKIHALAAALGAVLVGGFAAAALASAPEPWQLGFQPAATVIMEEVTSLHNLLLVIITAITAFVLGLLLFIVVRFRESANPTPSKTSHNTVLEVIWTVVPVMILVVIAVPSFKLLYHADRVPADQPVELTVKAIGHQWSWSYEYPDHGNLAFDAFLVPDEEIAEGQLRLLETDNRVVLPVDTNIRLLTTADDVIHSWAMPAFGVKIDAVPGRVNETWMRIEKPGVYYGQCSELCGVGHGYMPIAVQAVSKEEFAQWIEEAKSKFAAGEESSPASQLAQNQSAE